MLQVNDPANNESHEPRARVFISCGNRAKDTLEVETAKAIEALIFQESGVKQDDGIMRFVARLKPVPIGPPAAS
jgi:hypothetical protein